MGSQNLSLTRDGAEIKNDSVEGLRFRCVNPVVGVKYNSNKVSAVLFVETREFTTFTP